MPYKTILIRKTSLLDYPGQISTVLFFPGCNLRCPWCHNRELVSGITDDSVSFQDALSHIGKRRQVLGGVVLSGGEPCLQDELPDYVREIRKFKLPVKLDTNGMFPDMLEKLLGHDATKPDYIALDLKIAPARYAELLPLPAGWRQNEKADSFNPGEALIRSASLIRRSGIAHEYRTLALPGGFITEKDIEALAPLADEAPWHFRPFRGGNCLESAWNKLEEPQNEAEARAVALAKKAGELGKNGVSKIRN